MLFTKETGSWLCNNQKHKRKQIKRVQTYVMHAEEMWLDTTCAGLKLNKQHTIHK